MKFYGLPNMGVYERKTRRDIAKNKRPKLIFRFDERGEYVTEDVTLIARLKHKFRYEESKIENDEIEIKSEIKLRYCKTCGEAFENQGDLMRHCREEHPKTKGGD